MDDKQSASPPPVRSRASTMNTSSGIGPGTSMVSKRQPAITPPSSVSQASGIEQALHQAEIQANGADGSHSSARNDDAEGDSKKNDIFTKELPKINVSLRYGERFQEEYMVHLGVLARCSQTLLQLFTDAEKLRYAYDQGMKLRKKLRALLPPEVSKTEFCEEKTDDLLPQAVAIILTCWNSYPLLEYRVPIKDYIAELVDAVFQNAKFLKTLPGKGGFQRKDYPKMEVPHRLPKLNAPGVHYIMESLYQKLRVIKKQEEANGRINRYKAAAQRKIFLSNSDAHTVSSFVQWAYFEKLGYENARHLCKIHTLAENLGVEALAHSCVAMLSHATLASIQRAKDLGYSLRELVDEALPHPDLGFEEKSMGISPALGEVVPAVFRYVLRERGSSEALQALVIGAIADSGDAELFQFLRPHFKLEMALDLAQAMFLRVCEPKPELGDEELQNHHTPESTDQSIKSEMQVEGNGEDPRGWTGEDSTHSG